ncbi:MAG: hypothetical protein BYD32DRAFT_279364 [Podila humilis]|nr:MAG: hypothetical protein BYD32DRAFT_279364 [Podila humilis]
MQKRALKFMSFSKVKISVLHQHRPTGPNWFDGRGPLLFSLHSFILSFLCVAIWLTVLFCLCTPSYSANAMAGYYIKACQLVHEPISVQLHRIMKTSSYRFSFRRLFLFSFSSFSGAPMMILCS